MAHRQTPTTARLHLFATSDLHAHIWPHDYDLDRAGADRGLARLASRLRAARAAAPNSLLFDNGDLLQGTQLGDLAAARPGPHPIAGAMARLGYDAGTLGNHDFNYGLDVLERWLAHMPHPVTLANIVRRRGATPAEDTPFLPPAVWLERSLACDDGTERPLRVAVIGLAPPQTLAWDEALLAGRLEARGLHETAAALVPGLRAAGADLVVALCHSGLGRPEPDPGAEHAALSVARLPGVDAVIAGHSHRRLPGPDHAGDALVDAACGRLDGTPAVMPGAYGSDLGEIVLTLAEETDGGGWRVRQGESRLHPAAAAAPDPEVLAVTRAAHLATRRAARQVCGRLAAPLTGLFPLVCHSATLQFAADAQGWAAARLVAGTPGAALPLLSAVSPFKSGLTRAAPAFTEIPAGPVRRGHLAELAPFPNSLCVLEVDGATLRLWLERAVSGFATVVPGAAGAALTRPGAAGYNFEQIHGLRYRVDLSREGWFDAEGGALPQRPATARIAALYTADGSPVAPGDRFAVATNTYRAGGGGGYGFLAGRPRLATAAEPLRETLAAYLAAEPDQPRPLRPVWGFVPLAATAALISAAHADPARHGDGWRRLLPDGTEATGARRFLLDLSASDLPDSGQCGEGAPKK